MDRLDLFIPMDNAIGGYSMCSSPMEFQNSGIFELAVKRSEHIAATWMHNEVRFQLFLLCW